MHTETALFDSHQHAVDAVRALEAAGFDHNDVSILANGAEHGNGRAENDHAAEGAGAGFGIGALVGGAGGLLAGLGVLAIPGLGPVLGAGWLASTLVGAVTGATVGGAAGTIVGALTEAGVDERDAHVYAEGVRRGGTLVTVRTSEDRASLARQILHSSERVDIDERRTRYEQEGWDAFDPDAPEYTLDQIRTHRSHYGARGSL